MTQQTFIAQIFTIIPIEEGIEMTESSHEVQELESHGVKPGTVQITSVMYEFQAEDHAEALKKARNKCAQLRNNTNLAIEGKFELNESSIRTADYYENSPEDEQ